MVLLNGTISALRSGRPGWKARTREASEAFFLESLSAWRAAMGVDKMILVRPPPPHAPKHNAALAHSVAHVLRRAESTRGMGPDCGQAAEVRRNVSAQGEMPPHRPASAAAGSPSRVHCSHFAVVILLPTLFLSSLWS